MLMYFPCPTVTIPACVNWVICQRIGDNSEAFAGFLTVWGSGKYFGKGVACLGKFPVCTSSQNKTE